MVIENATGSPFTSAMSTSSGRMMAFISLAMWSNSWSVMGTKPQLSSHAAL